METSKTKVKKLTVIKNDACKRRGCRLLFLPIMKVNMKLAA